MLISGSDYHTINGLSQAKAAKRLAEEGDNELPAARARGGLAILGDLIRDPIFILLAAGGAIYLMLGDVQEALILLGFVLLLMGITWYQERKTEHTLEALRDLSSPRALVMRDGQQQRIAGREVVCGDIVVLREGDRIPADGVVLACTHLSVDESLLTGESVPVRKVVWDGKRGVSPPGGDDLPFVYAGTLVVQGQGIAEVKATGVHTAMGTIGTALQTVEPDETPLQRDLSRLVRQLAVVGGLLCVAVVVGYGVTRGHWLDGVLAGIALAMAILPNEFPVVLVIFLALGAWRISQQRVLTRHIPAVEALGAATVLCVDKTGTLMRNRMAVRQLRVGGHAYAVEHDATEPPPERFHEFVEFSLLACQRDPFDPMEQAVQRWGEATLAGTEHVHAAWGVVREYPLSSHVLATSLVWRSPQGPDYVIAAKGAPEAVTDLCHLDAPEEAALLHEVRAMADDGLRVLGVAKAAFTEAELPQAQHDFAFSCLGLIGLADSLRPEVPAALRDCYSAGLRVVMLTGDYPGTAQSIARQLHMTPSEDVLTGPDIEEMDEPTLQQRLRAVAICARIVPTQKLRIVNALKRAGDIVAMTGDGVNDAPALRAAYIGVAMGRRGTDVAREAADLVLLDDDFASLVATVRLGRCIFDNLHKAMVYLVAIHVPIAGMSLLPVHIAFLHLIIDPVCSVVFEAEGEEADVMRRPPRDPSAPLFGPWTLGVSMVQGLGILLVTAAVFGIALARG